MANNFLHDGRRLPVTSASGAITAGQFCVQEGLFGVAITSAKSGASLWLGARDVWNLPVPIGTTKGARLSVVDLSDAIGATIDAATTGEFFIGTAISDRDAAGNALVALGPQSPRAEP